MRRPAFAAMRLRAVGGGAKDVAAATRSTLPASTAARGSQPLRGAVRSAYLSMRRTPLITRGFPALHGERSSRMGRVKLSAPVALTVCADDLLWGKSRVA
ncbi:hypothetical protein MB84_28915 (plasmid) [Pandoraea oxalativorans]|uniref:Uncharacterized protein n=1 Tax=Pandoraea oxalativorans TaxID=573737 RepID=A0A0G3II70_9BURK|nr:hypothetical protein MB84_28915 [Pandoraea oxalativorans]